MIKNYTRLLLAALILFCFTGFSQTNYLQNASFENWSGNPESPDNWSIIDANSTTKSTDSSEGNFALELDLSNSLSTPTELSTRNASDVVLPTNATYTYSFDYKVTSGIGNTISANLYILKDAGSYTIQYLNEFVPMESDGDWHTYTVDFNTDTDEDYVFELAFRANTSPTSSVLIDNMKVLGDTPADADDDGVPDTEDTCPNTPPTALAVDENGCEILIDASSVIEDPSFEDWSFGGGSNLADWGINLIPGSSWNKNVTISDNLDYSLELTTGNNGTNTSSIFQNNIQLYGGVEYLLEIDYSVLEGTFNSLQLQLTQGIFADIIEEFTLNPSENEWNTYSTTFTLTSNEIVNLQIRAVSDQAQQKILLDKMVFRANVANNTDRDALIAFYNATGGPDWVNTWNLEEQDIENWYGVTLNSEGRVEYLYLTENKLIGNLPPEIGLLTELKVLNLSSASNPTVPENVNQITGVIPPQIGNLTNLEQFNISNNLISGEIPPEFGNLSKLTFAMFFDNELSGSLPEELGNLISIETINLKRNNIEGTIPTSMTNLPNLRSLLLASNNFEGEIPDFLSQVTSLQYLDLSYNSFSGSIPVELGLINNLSYLDISVNNLTGEIPTELGQLQNITTLKLSQNNLEGSLPLSLGQLTNLVDFQAYNNNLNGTIPIELTNIPSLDRILLSNNNFHGKIPNFASTNVYAVSISSNEFVFEDILEMSQNLAENITFSYYGQTNLGESSSIIINPTESYTLKIDQTIEPNNIYQWRLNEIPIDNATESTYVISNFSNEHQGAYDCVITNSLLPDLTLYLNPINIQGDDDNDGVPNDIDVCKNTPIGAVTGTTGCSYQDILVPKPDDIIAKATSTSCPDTANGTLTVEFKVNQTHILAITGPNNFSANYTQQNGSTLMVTDLEPGSYNIVANSEIGRLVGAPNVEFSLNIETPEEFISGKTVIDYTAKNASVVVSGSKNYEVLVNDKTYFFEFNNVDNQQLSFPLVKGANLIFIETDKNCQGIYNDSVIIDNAILSPNPVADILTVEGLDEMANAQILISNLNGATAIAENSQISGGTLEMNISSLSPGLYLLTITNGEKEINIKFVKK
ncbi:T9SS type A sorting domain-containing protein [Maribacter stanieri]|uniref:Por secretion system C-terminal sorting domain-containing protein n=1 Tax=Maribacter stanieri TaxID=440514 RepID=A0A1I6I946_9FLAO|nr:T9SS type A sorting domain-containing protein [Maribacter stanieri]SFR63179.1 Por secretion system C-terminal sorting domain-containing protein [Maribacter stanieri]